MSTDGSLNTGENSGALVWSLDSKEVAEVVSLIGECIPQTFIEHLLSARHCSRHLGHIREQENHESELSSPFFCNAA